MRSFLLQKKHTILLIMFRIDARLSTIKSKLFTLEDKSRQLTSPHTYQQTPHSHIPTDMHTSVLKPASS